MAQSPIAALAKRPTTNDEGAIVEIGNPLKYLYDNGLVFEINRTILHPVGLALLVQPDASNPRRGLKMVLLDCVGNPTVTFEPQDLERGHAKWRSWLNSRGIRAFHRRKQILGFSTQLPPRPRQSINR